ncbi:hypothetical protein QFC20_005621 [Naganishia adeliensis]|uniref:Uncharacterized protein n=1 Tax=Naganishia adeliensis TaxID=92952 RepID=A0ACC2VL31_9TREE|nr:hypothetical protein QFC20_005621 [Naganishia adeliensis]
MARSTESSSQDDHPAYKEKDSSVSQNDIDADHLPTLGAQPTMGKPDGPVITSKSKGVIGMELLASRLNTKYLILLYGGFILLAYTLSLDQYTSGTYNTYATSQAFEAHSLLATIGVIRAIFQSISQPPMAKIADVFGRVNAYILSVFLYVLGYIIQASAPSIYVSRAVFAVVLEVAWLTKSSVRSKAYAVGNAIYILGITSLFLLQNIIISDISSLRNRVLMTILPNTLPGCINVWTGGDVAASVLANAGWRWGIGMFAIITPVLSVPIIAALATGSRARKVKDVEEKEKVQEITVVESLPWKERTVSMFWQLDLIGLLLFIGGAGMFLVTITLANNKTKSWADGDPIHRLAVVGLALIVVFILYERFFARHPLIPLQLLTNPTVIICFVIALLHPVAGRIVSGYYFTFLLVAAEQGNKWATRLSNIGSLSGTIMAVAAGFAVRYTRRVKYVVIFGFICQTLGTGLMIRFRTSTNSRAELAAVQVVRGFGSGCISFPIQAALQSASKHERIWTNKVPGKLQEYFTNSTLATQAYKNPTGFIVTYLPGTPERIAIARAHDETQRLMVIVGMCISATALVVACFIPNIRLPDTQSIEDEEPTLAGAAYKEGWSACC